MTDLFLLKNKLNEMELMLRNNTINRVNELMQPALELGFDWPSNNKGYIEPIKLTTEELIDFLKELELFVGRINSV
jgi:hypothetical protein